MKTKFCLTTLALAALLGTTGWAASLGTTMTYQGRLLLSDTPANGVYDLTFQVYSVASGGVANNPPITNLAVTVDNGLFTALVDFGNRPADHNDYWLELGVRTNGSGTFVPLAPRQALTATPFAWYADMASNAVVATTALTASGLAPSVSTNYVLKAGDTMSGTLNVNASVIASGLGTTTAVVGKNGAGVLSAPTSTGIYGVSYDADGNGVMGEANSGSLAYGIFGKSSSGYAGFFDGKVQVNGNASITSNLMAGGAVTAASFVGNGAGLTNLNFVGNGAGLTNLNAWLPTGNAFGGKAYLYNNNGPVVIGSSESVIISGAFEFRSILTVSLPDTASFANILGGLGSATSPGVVGATVSGGGYVVSHFGFPSTVTTHSNIISGDFGSIGGGFDNVAGYKAVVSGGQGNQAAANLANIGGGFANANNGPASVIGGGYQNAIQASANNATLGGGSYNTISSGAWNAVIPGGDQNTVGANCTGSFAAGHRAKVNQPGSFIWADGNDFDFSTSIAQNQVRFRSTGGFDIVTGINETTGVPTTGVWMMTGDNSWRAISDRRVKKNIQPVDGAAVLDKLAQVPVSQWHYNWEKDNTTLHLGPMAQDFIHAFYPGENDKSITTMQFDGVELAAIQGLNQKLEAEAKAKDVQIESLKQSVAELKKLVQTIIEKK